MCLFPPIVRREQELRRLYDKIAREFPFIAKQVGKYIISVCFYLRRSRQVLELCKLLLLLLLWGGAVCQSFLFYFGFLNSLRGRIQN